MSLAMWDLFVKNVAILIRGILIPMLDILVWSIIAVVEKVGQILASVEMDFRCEF